MYTTQSISGSMDTNKVPIPAPRRPRSASPHRPSVTDAPMMGYDNEFVDPPPDALCCLGVCTLPFREPHLLGCCGKKICEPCIERVRLAGKPCPFCNQPIVTLLDRELRSRVLDLKVFCLKKRIGCEWQGELRDLQNHVEKCAFVEESCRYQCGGRYPRCRLAEHEREECPQRPLDVKFDSMARKMETKFSQYEKRIAQLETKLHLKDEASKAAMEDQRAHFDKIVRAQQETIVRLAEQLFCPPCKLTMPMYYQHKLANDYWFSPPFYSGPGGYKFCFAVHANGLGDTHVSVFVYLMRGEHDYKLSWPFEGEITFQLVNQKRDHQHVEETIVFGREAVAYGSANRVTSGERAKKRCGKHKFISFIDVETSSDTIQYLHSDCLTFRILRTTVVHSTVLHAEF